MGRYTEIYAVLYDHGKEVSRTLIGKALFDADRITARKYNSVKRKAISLFYLERGQYFRLETEDGRKDTFGGHPAYTFVTFK